MMKYIVAGIALVIFTTMAGVSFETAANAQTTTMTTTPTPTSTVPKSAPATGHAQ